jgi:hypothetical protein
MPSRVIKLPERRRKNSFRSFKNEKWYSLKVIASCAYNLFYKLIANTKTHIYS